MHSYKLLEAVGMLFRLTQLFYLVCLPQTSTNQHLPVLITAITQSANASLYTSHPREASELFATAACDGALRLWDLRVCRWVCVHVCVFVFEFLCVYIMYLRLCVACYVSMHCVQALVNLFCPSQVCAHFQWPSKLTGHRGRSVQPLSQVRCFRF